MRDEGYTPDDSAEFYRTGGKQSGTSAYVLWLDDNSVTNPDALYTIDNVSFTGVPEPTSGFLLLSAAGVLGWMRRRRPN